MSDYSLYGTPIARFSVNEYASSSSQDLYNKGRVQLNHMNELLYRSSTIDSIVIEQTDWKPSNFSSSRDRKHIRENENFEKYMDDDDLLTLEAKRVLVPVVKQTATRSIAKEFLEYVKWRQNKSEIDHDFSTDLYRMFERLKLSPGHVRGLYSPSKTLIQSLLPKGSSKEVRKVKKRRINVKLSISDDYDVEEYEKEALPSISRSQEAKPKFIPRSNRLLKQTQENPVNDVSGTKDFEVASRPVKYGKYAWAKHDSDSGIEGNDSKIEKNEKVKLETSFTSNVQEDLKPPNLTVGEFKSLAFVPPLDSEIASTALKSQTLPFHMDTAKQQRYLFFLKVYSGTVSDNAFFDLPKFFTLTSWKHELDEFAQVAFRYRPLSEELAQRFAPATNRLSAPEQKTIKRTVENFNPAPLLLTRLGLPQIKNTPDSPPFREIVDSTFNAPPQTNTVNLYENLSLLGGTPSTVFETIFKKIT